MRDLRITRMSARYKSDALSAARKHHCEGLGQQQTWRMLFHSPARRRGLSDRDRAPPAHKGQSLAAHVVPPPHPGYSAGEAGRGGKGRTQLALGLQPQRVQAAVRVLPKVVRNRHQLPVRVEYPEGGREVRPGQGGALSTTLPSVNASGGLLPRPRDHVRRRC